MTKFRFALATSGRPRLTRGDAVVILVIAALLYGGIELGLSTPAVVRGPQISLAAAALPWYTLLSVTRMLAAYGLSLAFSIVYGYFAARNSTAQRILMPLLDVLQSVPILSFLPIVLLGASAFIPSSLAAELTAVVLIFTSQAWNLTFSFYQSVSTVPREMDEAARIFRFGFWMRLRVLELPFAAVGLIWNSIMSWAGGWFFLMAAEMFHVGNRDFRLPGLGSYLQTAANHGDTHAILLGLLTLIVVIVALDQGVWRPLLAWAERFKVAGPAREEPASSWLLPLLMRSRILAAFRGTVIEALNRRLDRLDLQRDHVLRSTHAGRVGFRRWLRPGRWLLVLVGAAVLYAVVRAGLMLSQLSPGAWLSVLEGLLATLGRVAAALFIALVWTVPLGVALGNNERLARIVQPLAEILASVPATALFPVILVGLIHLPGGLNIAAVLLMLLGTQWYLLFNVIAGSAAIPDELRNTTRMLGLSRLDRWRTLYLPALFPYIITGAVTSSGGAWNASIVAEYVEFSGKAHSTVGLGALIAQATGSGNYPMLLAATLTMILAVVLINRIVWHRLYALAERRYRME